MRGQSVIEYLLGLSIVLIGVVALLSRPVVVNGWRALYGELVVRIARDVP